MTNSSRHLPERGNRGRRTWGLVLAAGAGLIAGPGCRQGMYDQPRYEPLEASSFFPDGLSSRPLVEGTVPRDSLPYDDYLAKGYRDGKPAEDFPFPITRADLERGRERFNIFCAPCHGQRGDGRGMIVQRGFPAPPPFYGPFTRVTPVDTGPVSLYSDLRKAPAGHFVHVIAEGHGVMYSYASRVAPEDRWRIAAYIRALQLSRYATADDLKKIPDPTPKEAALLEEVGR